VLVENCFRCLSRHKPQPEKKEKTGEDYTMFTQKDKGKKHPRFSAISLIFKKN